MLPSNPAARNRTEGKKMRETGENLISHCGLGITWQHSHWLQSGESEERGEPPKEEGAW